MKDEKLEKALMDLEKAIEDIEKVGGSIVYELSALREVNIIGVYYRESTNDVVFY